jgi:AcrR family transcriptional regulator
MTSKSSRTKARIMDAARSEFSRHGYQGATVRAIASAARIDPSMIIRYFDSKAGLFDAVCEISLRLPALGEVPRDAVGALLVRHFLTRWEGDAGDDSLVLLLRSGAVDPEAALRLNAIFAGQLLPALAEVVDDPEEVPARVGLVASQMLGLALTRSILRIPPVVSMTPDEIVARIGPTVQRYLTAPLPAS